MTKKEFAAYIERLRKQFAKACFIIVAIGLVLLVCEKYYLEAKHERDEERDRQFEEEVQKLREELLEKTRREYGRTHPESASASNGAEP